MTESPFRLEAAIQTWRENLSGSAQFRAENLNELETHLRDSIGALRGKGLSDDEAFLIAARRIGSATALEPEFAKVNAREVWLNRVMWMLFGIQAWGLISGLAGTVSRWVVIGGFVGSGYEVHGRSAFEISLVPTIMFTIANVVALGLALWVCWRFAVRGRATGLSAAISDILQRPVGLAIMVVGGWLILLLATNASFYFEELFFAKKLSVDGFNALLMSRSYSWMLVRLLQMLAMLTMTAVLARRLLLRKLQPR